MSWNYRVVRNEDGLRIFDVYYDESGKPIGSNAAPTHVYGDSVDDLREQMNLMLDALALPILEKTDIGRK